MKFTTRSENDNLCWKLNCLLCWGNIISSFCSSIFMFSKDQMDKWHVVQTRPNWSIPGYDNFEVCIWDQVQDCTAVICHLRGIRIYAQWRPSSNLNCTEREEDQYWYLLHIGRLILCYYDSRIFGVSKMRKERLSINLI